MKRFLSFVIAIALIFSSFLSLQVSAAEQELTGYDQVIALAKETFPEYAKKLDGGCATRSNEPQTVTSEINAIVQKTRAVDSNTTMTYTEYNNGIVTLGTARFVKDAKIIVEDSETHSNYEQFTATIIATVVEGPVFTSTNVQYKIYPSDYDRIVSVGNYGIPGYSSDDFVCRVGRVETATTPAYISYSFPTPVGTVYFSGSVVFEIKNNIPSVEFNIW